MKLTCINNEDKIFDRSRLICLVCIRSIQINIMAGKGKYGRMNMDYQNILEGIVAGDANSWQQLHTLLWQDYNYMLSEIENKEQADKLFNSAFSSVASNINSQTKPDMIGDIFRRKLEWEISSVSAAHGQGDFHLNQANRINQGIQVKPEAQINQGIQANQQPYPNPQMQPYGYGMQAGQTANAAPKKRKAPLIIGIVAALIVIAGILLAVFVFGKKKFDKEGYQDILDKYFECYTNQDMKGMESYYPEDSGEQVWDTTLSYLGYSSEEEYWQALTGYYGDPFTISCTIDDSEEVSDTEMSRFEKQFNSMYDTECELDYLIKAEVTENTTGSLNSYTASETLYLGVIDGKWYILGAYY